MNLEEILADCARLRGVSNLSWRTLHEFNAFVSNVIWDQPNLLNDKIWTKWINKARTAKVFAGSNQILKVAKFFHEYCKEEYKPQTISEFKKEVENFRTNGLQK